MIQINYFMSHGSPWTFLGHNRLGKIVKKFNVKLNMYPVNYGEIFPISGGLPVSKRPPQRQKLRLQELKRWSEFLRVNLIPQPTFFPSKSLLPSLIIIAAKIKKTNKDLVNVFVPTTPNPTSGFLLMFPKDEVIYLDMTFEEASKFIVSAGTSDPADS